MYKEVDSRVYHRLLKIPGGKPVRYNAGQDICMQGSKANSLVIVSGADIKVQYLSTAGKKYTISQEANYFGVLGEMELFSGSGTYMFSVTAVNLVVGYQLRRDVVIKALATMPDLAMEFLELISSRYQRTVGKTIDNILNGLRFNVLKRLVELSEAAHHGVFTIAQDIEAENLGTSTRAYRRIIKSLMDDGLLEKQRNAFKLTNPDLVFSKKLS